MSSQDKEKLSAFLDGDLHPEELEEITSILQEQGAGFQTAARYQIAGEALRGQTPDAAIIDVSAQVREALRDEPGHVYDSASARPSNENAGWSMPDFGAWFRPLGGLAIAASVALVTVLVVTQVEAPDANNSLVAETEKSEFNVAQPSAVTVARPVVVAVESPQTLDPRTINLDAYLAEHAEFAAQDTLQGRMPYVRAVSYESE